MWSFFKRSRNTQSNDVDTLATLPTHDEVEAFFESQMGVGSHFAMLYANMQGYRGVVVQDDFEKYLDLIEREPNFLDADVDRAADKFLRDMSIIVNPKSYWLPDGLIAQNPNDPRIRQSEVLKCLKRIGVEEFLDQIEFDIPAYLKRVTSERRRSDLKFIANTFITKKDVLKPLFRKASLQSTNKYGDKDYGNLRSEVEEFCTYSFPEESLRFYYCYIPWKFIYSIVEDWLAEDQFSGEAPKDGVEFEHWCADRITQQGWTATVSQASGDQGVDVIATRNGTTVAVQCKRYSQPIGNKAIQEAFAGMKHYNANFACVIGSGGFTRAAEELATSTGVTLLDYQMIGDFSERHGFANASKGGSTSVGHNHLIFETPAEKVLSRLFRAAALSYPEEAKLDDNIIRKIMAFTDEDDGSGELTCSRNEFAGLLIFSSLLLCGAFVVLDAKREDILAMKFPRSNEVANLPNGQEVRFYELLGEELLLEVQAKLRVWCQHLGLNAEAIDTALNIKWSQ